MWIVGRFKTVLQHSHFCWVYVSRKGDELLITDGAGMYLLPADKGDVYLPDGGEFVLGDFGRHDKYPPAWERWATLISEKGEPIQVTPFCVDQPMRYYDPYDEADEGAARVFAVGDGGGRVYVRRHYIDILGDLDGLIFTFTRQTLKSDDMSYYHVIAWQDGRPIAVFASMRPEAFEDVDKAVLTEVTQAG